ncbi:hypothetical protein ACU4GD_43690 [Cupriavidus basilensis]
MLGHGRQHGWRGPASRSALSGTPTKFEARRTAPTSRTSRSPAPAPARSAPGLATAMRRAG